MNCRVFIAFELLGTKRRESGYIPRLDDWEKISLFFYNTADISIVMMQVSQVIFPQFFACRDILLWLFLLIIWPPYRIVLCVHEIKVRSAKNLHVGGTGQIFDCSDILHRNSGSKFCRNKVYIQKVWKSLLKWANNMPTISTTSLMICIYDELACSGWASLLTFHSHLWNADTTKLIVSFCWW